MAPQDSMRRALAWLGRLPLLKDGRPLVGITFVITGFIVGREGILGLARLWHQLSSYFPISSTPDLSHRILMSFPLIFNYFICFVGSLSAVLIGLLWVFSGLAETFQDRSASDVPAGFQDPGSVAEALRTGHPDQRAGVPFLARALGYVWPAARSMSPVSSEMFRGFLLSAAKISLWVLLIAAVVHLLRLVPNVVGNLFNHSFILVVPSAGPLYTLVIAIAAADIFIALTLVPLRRRAHTRAGREFNLTGGHPLMLFAMIEEGCRLLAAKGSLPGPAVRLLAEADHGRVGTLVESLPARRAAAGRPAAYLCLPAAVVLISLGFDRLVNFHRPAQQMVYWEFFSQHVLFYALDVAFAFGLILCGLHLADCARRLFGVCSFSSILVFCHTSEPSRSPAPGGRHNGTESQSHLSWKVAAEVDERFAEWARRPDAKTRFRAGFCWAEALSEASGGESPRHLLELKKSDFLDEAMNRIIELPFFVAFCKEQEARDPKKTPAGRIGE